MVTVLVVGSGPVGAECAVELRRWGIENVRLIDKLPNQSLWAKATAIQVRSLEIFDNMTLEGMNLIHRLKERSLTFGKPQIIKYNDQNEPSIVLTLNMNGATDGIFPNGFLVEQWFTENVLLDALETFYGTRVERGVEAVSLEDRATHIDVSLKHENGEIEKIEAEYVIGCDGAHSFVRHNLDIPFEGEKLEQKFILIHLKLELEQEIYGFFVTMGANGWVFATPLPDETWVFIIDLFENDLEQYLERHNGVFEDPTVEDFNILLPQRGIPQFYGSSPEDVVWVSHLNIHSRQVPRYSQGRLFLCGDAAHVHSPVGGQGMNTGIQDAHNLAWKLALVLKNRAGMSILDSYHEERHAVGEFVVQITDIVTKSQLSRNPIWSLLRNNTAAFMGSFQSVIESAAQTLGQTTYSYKNQCLAKEYWYRPSLLHIPSRRRQNMTRMLQHRPVAGDRAKNIPINLDYDLFHVLKMRGDDPPFIALLFEGDPNYSNTLLDQDLDIVSSEIDRVFEGWVQSHVVSASNRSAHEKYGIVSQAMYMIRPDGYIGLRSEPVSLLSIQHYLASIIHAVDIRNENIKPPVTHDWVPYVLLCGFIGVCVFGVLKLMKIPF